MGRSKESFNKKEVRKKQEKKRKDKEAKRLARKSGEQGSGLDSMIAYVDEFGNITSTPPDTDKKEEINAEDIVVGVPKGGFNDEELNQRKGIVSFFNEQKGYGFIRDLANNQSLFVHINNVEGQLKEGNKVTFEIGKGERGPVAMNVTLAD